MRRRIGWGGVVLRYVCSVEEEKALMGVLDAMLMIMCYQIFPTHRSGADSRRVGPGVEMRADPVERRRRNGQELDMYTSLE